MRTVGIGHQDFQKIRTSNIFYVDKTDFIREWWDANDEVTLIARPRRFGKTLTLSMLECFFSVGCSNKSCLFEGLHIWEEERFRRLQGTYPVIFLSFAGVKESRFPDARENICRLIEKIYNQYDFLLQGDLLNDKEKDYYHAVCSQMSDSIASVSLNTLMDFLSRYYGKKVIMLLDEYDTPLQEAYVNGYWEELSAFIRGLFNSTFKTNPHLERGLMTGITRISKESIFSDLNNLTVITATSDKYADCFGFTESEVADALNEFGYPQKMPDVKRWYDGFIFGDKPDIYNPWSIINFLNSGKLGLYWANTSGNALISRILREGSTDLKVIMEDLLAGKSFHTQIDEQIIFSQLDHNESAVWSLLLASGYLKAVKSPVDPLTGKEDYELSLTNLEVRFMFRQLINEWFAQFTPAYNTFIKALLLGDLDAMNTYINRVALSTFSYFDTGSGASAESGAEPERFYHGFVLGLIVDLADPYTLTSNRESGFGRYDVMMEPKNEQNDAIILEFKVRRPNREKSLEDTVQNALEQIDRKKYTAILEQKGYPPKRIRKYGFAFEGKRVLIGESKS